MSQKQPLLQESELEIISSEENLSYIKENPISQYNYVVKNYNSEYCVVDNIKLKMMKESSFYSKLYPLLRKSGWSLLICLVLIIVPVVNIVTYLIIITNLAKYFAALSIFRENLKKNPDPFRNMIFSTEICESIKKINWAFDIEVSRNFYEFFIF